MDFSPERPALFVNPDYRPMQGASRPVIDPATLETVGMLAAASDAEIDAALTAANEAQGVWKKLDAKNKQPFAFDLANGKMLAFAGLWDAWKDPANGQWLQSYTIITTEANELMAPVHDRMPVILRPRDFDRWLDREPTDKPPIYLLRPFPADEMETFEVSKDVGNVRNNSAELLNSP